VRTKPRSIADLVDALVARAGSVSLSASVLLEASRRLGAHQNAWKEKTLQGLLIGYTELSKGLAELAKAEGMLRADLQTVRHAVKVVNRSVGVGRVPGRPRVISDSETQFAKRMHELGASWERVRRELNGRRRQFGRQPLPATTIRSAVTRLVAKTSRSIKR